MDMSSSRNSSLILMISVGLLAAYCQSAPALANDVHKGICFTAWNLGAAAARAQYFGEAFGGAPPADQLSNITTHLSNAAATAKSLESQLHPFWGTAPHRERALSSLLNDIGRYSAVTTAYVPADRAHWIRQIADNYAQSMAVTYSSLQPASGFINTPTCDSQLFKTCYHFGHAQIGATFVATPAGNALRIVERQSATISLLRQAIDGGLFVDFYDGGEYMAGNYDRRHKLCCSMTGAQPPGVTPKAVWAPIRSIPPNAPTAVFEDLYAKLMGIVQSAGIAGEECAGNSKHTCTTATGVGIVPPRPDTPLGHGMINNVNLPGHDYANRATNDPRQCQASCQADGRCAAWTWVRPGVQGQSGQCWLKSPVPQQVADNNAVSGVVRTPTADAKQKQGFYVWYNRDEYTCCKGPDGRAPHPLRYGRASSMRADSVRLAGEFANESDMKQWICNRPVHRAQAWISNWSEINGILISNLPCQSK